MAADGLMLVCGRLNRGFSTGIGEAEVTGKDDGDEEDGGDEERDDCGGVWRSKPQRWML